MSQLESIIRRFSSLSYSVLGLTAGIAGVGVANAPGAKAAAAKTAQSAEIKEAVISELPAVQKAMQQVLIGANCYGVGKAPNVLENRFDPTRKLEAEMKAEVDVVNYYGAINDKAAENYKNGIVPELKRNSQRRIMYAVEIWRNNTDFLNQMEEGRSSKEASSSVHEHLQASQPPTEIQNGGSSRVTSPVPRGIVGRRWLPWIA
jgi:hypothetical protein